MPGTGPCECSNRMPAALPARAQATTVVKAAMQPATIIPSVGVGELRLLALVVSGIDDVAGVVVAA